MAAVALAGGPVDPNSPGILEPALTATTGQDIRIPNTDQASGDTLLNLVGAVVSNDVLGQLSILGDVITRADSPNDDMRDDLGALSDAAHNGDAGAMTVAAQDLLDILQGNTHGRIYDGFAMLNYNQGAYAPDQLPDEYKMKMVQNTGESAPSIDGAPHTVWDVTVNMLWYDGQFDSDTFLLKVPIEADPFDTLRVHYRIYSLVTEDFAPTGILQDVRLPGSVQFPFKGFDSVWQKVSNNTVTQITVDYPPLKLLRGVYTWGWRVHPPRIQFMQPVFEQVNQNTQEVELEPQGKSFVFRNRQLSIDGISDAAPEKKMLLVAQAVLDGASPTTVDAMLNDPATAPRGVWQDWADLVKDQLQIPDEAWDVLANEGLAKGDFGPYRFISVYMNNEMYGRSPGPDKAKIQGWFQGDRFQVKLINLDNHTHYFRNVDFGPKLHDDISSGSFASGSHSFEIMNFKPTYGVPKVAESQWRAGWGFRPHNDVIQQQDVFSRPSDQAKLKPYTDGAGNQHFGYQYSAIARGGDFRFNPPPQAIGTATNPSANRLKDEDGQDGLLIGQLTEGYGVAKMCDAAQFPLGDFCRVDISQFNPNGVKNIDTDMDGVPDVLWFPPFLRNPNPSAGGDILPPTPAWKPFLWINPNNGTLFIDPNDPSLGYWADLTYAHGAPIHAGDSLSATIEAARASGQVFYQFDPLFHDNAIFSPHPTFAPNDPPATNPADLNGDGVVNGADLAALLIQWGTNGPADLNNDGVVNGADLATLLTNWG